jgi:hypothetical protein
MIQSGAEQAAAAELIQRRAGIVACITMTVIRIRRWHDD